jgi:hypothetical protein
MEYGSQKASPDVLKPLLYIYRVIQKESALLWEIIVCVILSKKVHTNMGPILNGYGVMGII